MKSSSFTRVAALLGLNVYCSMAQIPFETRDHIKLSVSAHVSFNADNGFLYRYGLSNAVQAKQSVWKFTINALRSLNIDNVKAPVDWNTGIFQRDITIIRWFADDRDDSDEFKDEIKPGDSRTGYSYETRSLPGIVAYYSEGWADPPKFQEGMAEDSLPGYDDLTPYGPGVVGRTVGPVLPPDPFDPVGFLDTLRLYTFQADTLDWIVGHTTANKYSGYFISAKTNLQNGNLSAARATLRQVLRDADGDSSSALSSEAYALLRYNTEYLLSKLPAPPGKD